MDNFKIVLSATAYKPSNTASIEKDDKGYYKVRLGAFNVYNSGKAFYTSDGVKDLINNPNSFFWRRLKKGYLYGEMGHPGMKPGMTMSEFMNRNATIDMTNIAFHIRDVILRETNEKVTVTGNHGNVVIMEGWIKPSGPKGPLLQEALDNPDRNVAFSVRSLSKDTNVNGVIVKKTVAILTWDWVVEPGINNANTFDMLNNKVINTESVDNLLQLEVTDKDINSVMSNIETSEATGVLNHEDASGYKEIWTEVRAELPSNNVNKRVLKW